MNEGLMKTASSLAIMTAASVLASSAYAADLGGNCCADLEERVAELEATTVRKGNRKVSLQISGQVNRSVMFWDDGAERNVYSVDNEFSSTRFRFLGDAKINSDFSAGYLLEWEVFSAARSDTVNQGANFQGPQAGDDPQALNTNLNLRHSAWYLDSKTYGRLWVGHTSAATDGITYINLSKSNLVSFSKSHLLGNGFFLRRSGVSGSAGLSALTWGAARSQGGGADISLSRHDLVKYVSPTLHGFIFSASWGEDDVWDLSLKYANEFNGVRVAWGIGYAQINDGGFANGGTTNAEFGCADTSVVNVRPDTDCSIFNLGASIMHVPTGLFVTGTYAERRDDNRRALFGNTGSIDKTDTNWHIQAGIERNWFGIGATTLVGQYGIHEAGSGLNNGSIRTVAAADPLNGSGAAARINSADVTVWGLGLIQGVDAAAMDLYLSYHNYSADVTLMNGANSVIGKSRSIDDFSAVMAGGIIRF